MRVIRIRKKWLKGISAAFGIFVTCLFLMSKSAWSSHGNGYRSLEKVKNKYSALSNIPPSELGQLLNRPKSVQNEHPETRNKSVIIAPILHDEPRIFSNIPMNKRTGNFLDDLLVITTVTSSFIDFTENWLAGIERLPGDRPSIYIIAEDEETYVYFDKKNLMPKVNIVKSPKLEENSTLLFDTTEYKNFVNKRPRYILDLLRRGYDVLFSDVDIVWLEAPYPYFHKKFDIHILEDQGPPKPTIYCAGFVMYQATNVTMQFVDRWIREINHFKDPRPDQELLNRLIKKKPSIRRPVPDIKLQVLDPRKFVSGRHYFNETWRTENPSVKPVILHNNWIKGHDVKVERFKELDMWFV